MTSLARELNEEKAATKNKHRKKKKLTGCGMALRYPSQAILFFSSYYLKRFSTTVSDKRQHFFFYNKNAVEIFTFTFGVPNGQQKKRKRRSIKHCGVERTVFLHALLMSILRYILYVVYKTHITCTIFTQANRHIKYKDNDGILIESITRTTTWKAIIIYLRKMFHTLVKWQKK